MLERRVDLVEERLRSRKIRRSVKHGRVHHCRLNAILRKRVGLSADLKNVKRLKKAVCNNYGYSKLVCRLA
jgi:hypothetical protein